MTSTYVGPESDSDEGWTTRKVLIILMPLLIIGSAFIVLAVVVALHKKPEEKRSPFTPLAVMADYAVKENVTLEVTTQGEAKPRTEIDLVPQVGGKIVYVSPNFLEGGIFTKGEVLVRIDDSDYKVDVIRAEAGVAQAEQVLVREVAEGEIARRDYEELSRGTPSELALRKPQRQQAEAALQAAKAELQSAKINLARTALRAPFNGRVRSKASDVGQYVTPGSRLGNIFSTDIIEVRLPLTDDDLSKLDLPLAYVANNRQTAPYVRLSAIVGGKMRNWDAHIMRTDSVYDTQTRALYAIAEVYDPYGDGASKQGVPLAPGMFVTADLTGKSYEDVIVIPRDGLRPKNEVYIVDDKGQVDIRHVTVLDTNAERAVLFDGVKAGELIVLSPMERSRASMTLKALDVNDPSKVLVDPPEPEWMKKKTDEKKAAADKKKKKKGLFGWGKADKEKAKKSDEQSGEKSEDDETPDENETHDSQAERGGSTDDSSVDRGGDD